MAESGEALIRKYDGIDDLFTPAGYAAYADDLLQRMTNPHLRDSIERVGRDPRRKLGWHDRLVGTMRVCLTQSVASPRFAMGAAAALVTLDANALDSPTAAARDTDPSMGICSARPHRECRHIDGYRTGHAAIAHLA